MVDGYGEDRLRASGYFVLLLLLLLDLLDLLLFFGAVEGRRRGGRAR